MSKLKKVSTHKKGNKKTLFLFLKKKEEMAINQNKSSRVNLLREWLKND
jgi:hypothetical protein